MGPDRNQEGVGGRKERKRNANRGKKTYTHRGYGRKLALVAETMSLKEFIKQSFILTRKSLALSGRQHCYYLCFWQICCFFDMPVKNEART